MMWGALRRSFQRESEVRWTLLVVPVEMYEIVIQREFRLDLYKLFIILLSAYCFSILCRICVVREMRVLRK